MTYEEVKRIRDDGVIEDVVDLLVLSRMIDKAIDKQIPMKPEYEDYEAICPVCEHEFEYGINEWGSAFCQDCGQALDWSDSE